ncbi:MAG: efflux RND transporter periplasmic adaptor subunit [Solirubrobacterales bacterium]
MKESEQSAVNPVPFYRRIPKAVWIAAGILVFCGIVALNIYRINQSDALTVRMISIKERRLVDTVLSSGRVSSDFKETLFSSASASVRSVRVHLGDPVQPGQVLLELNIPEARQKLLEARSDYYKALSELEKARSGSTSLESARAYADYQQAFSDWEIARSKAERSDALHAAGALSLEETENARRDLAVKQAVLERARASLNATGKSAPSTLRSLQLAADAARTKLSLAEDQEAGTRLKSTISGRVLSIQADSGDVVQPNAALITIGDLDHLRIKADVSEADAVRIRPGQKVAVASAAMPDRKLTGKVLEVGLEAVNKSKNQTETNTVPVIVSVRPDSGLLPGFNVDLEIIASETKHALTVPYDALKEINGKTYCFVVKEQKAHLVLVTTGIEDGLRIQIRSGLRPGDQVIVDPPAALKNNRAVKPL